uniref:Uncharacterized protein n=1 Tax=Micrurus corallinus TaxID=54390 RepID=A0A2D4F7I1_MICCO
MIPANKYISQEVYISCTKNTAVDYTAIHVLPENLCPFIATGNTDAMNITPNLLPLPDVLSLHECSGAMDGYYRRKELGHKPHNQMNNHMHMCMKSLYKLT